MAKELQGHIKKKKELEIALDKNNALQINKSIPKQYRPRRKMTTVQPNTTLATNFDKKYEQLFFEHLDKVITNDSISLELTKATILNILAQTETYLASLHVAPHLISDLYHNFLLRNNITDRQPLPELQKKITSTTHTIPTSLTDIPKPTLDKPNANKRKRHDQHPPGQKERKVQDHFLSLGPPQPPDPP